MGEARQNYLAASRTSQTIGAIKMRYAIVYFGRPNKLTRGSNSIEKAISIAKAANGSGTCTAARVYECETLALARTADISIVRKGERMVFEA